MHVIEGGLRVFGAVSAVIAKEQNGADKRADKRQPNGPGGDEAAPRPSLSPPRAS
jgi:hypothetical protein